MAVKSADQLTIIDVTDAYSVILTNDSYTFLGSTNAAKPGSTTTQVIALRGAEQVAASVTISEMTVPEGITVSKNTDPLAPTLTITATAALTQAGVVKIPVHIGDVTIVKDFSFAIAFTGVAGAAGAAGATWYSGTKITGTSTTGTVFANSGVSSAKVGDMYLNTSTQNVYKCTVGGAASVAKWAYSCNIKGADGDPGAAGEDALSLVITSSNGVIFKNSAIETVLTAHVYKGGVEVTNLSALGTIKWYKDGGTTAIGSGVTLVIDAGDVTGKATYTAQLEG